MNLGTGISPAPQRMWVGVMLAVPGLAWLLRSTSNGDAVCSAEQKLFTLSYLHLLRASSTLNLTPSSPSDQGLALPAFGAMANKKVRQRISYVLPLANSPGGHRLGVNGLAVDSDQSILYSGGRDGAICAWNLNIDLKTSIPPENPFDSPDDPTSETSSKTQTSTTFRAQTQAHTHWVNDIVLAQNNTALVSASSDLTVRVWRPLSNESEAPQTVGQHADYVKCVATPGPQSDWVASGGLDRRICLWDLSGAGKKLEIEVGDEEKSEKGSVYALSVSRSILASGGPESIVRLWDPRTGKRVTKFVGHTDNIRDILVSESGDTIMTASSDQTVKVWSVTAGRCMHTLTMHNDSVWSLFSDDPDLGVFYSSDRSGLVVKTDVRGTLGEMDDGLSLAVAHENEGVNKVIACGDHIWTATSSSSINRWTNIDTGSDIQLPEAYRRHRASSAASRPRQLSTPVTTGGSKKEIPAQSVLRISNTASFPAPAARDSDAATTYSALSGARKASEVIIDPDIGVIIPIHALPEETIEGQHGLVKHKLLNDRRRACIPIQSFGKRHLEDVEPEVNTMEAVAPWCSIDTRTGRLAVVLEEYNCFDAEMYADELELDQGVEFRDDQRINLGKWILRHIFSNLIDEMIKRDEVIRKELNDKIKKGGQRANAPTTIQIPAAGSSWADNSALTPRGNGHTYPMTPGMGIGVATPAALNHLPGVPEDGAPLDKKASQASRTSADKTGDYFSNTPLPSEASSKPIAETLEAPPKSPSDTDKETNGKDGNTLFGKKFRMGMGSMSFGSKKLGRSASTATTEKPVVIDEKVEDGSETSSSGDKEKEVDDNFFGIVQKIRNEYDRFLLENPETRVETAITPSLPNETPVLKPPPMTTVIIQEETSGGSADLYRGTVATVGEDATLIAERAPMWLGDLLLRNKIPIKEPVKVSFVLQPWQDLLPSIAGPDGNSRLNANRMLRVKKILAYVAERIEAAPEQPDPDALRPEEYLELYCYDQKLPITMSLATLRAHVWKGGADVMLYYKANGRKPIAHAKAPESTPGVPAAPTTPTT
ncbi:related to WD repeat-containing protein 48 [Rhynchosporium graminicola]|uniref:Related to WD repeat-containing protein 48 n=1 Tax=Rhynchosporium graminicola TaxID=2792576 RepID=A0A1E1KWM1_9HELO|nr:related to WD repeat-containing protein 48 [Rhynchosporium commune]